MSLRSLGTNLIAGFCAATVLLSGFISEVWPHLIVPDRKIAVPTPWPDPAALDLPVPSEASVLDVGRPV